MLFFEPAKRMVMRSSRLKPSHRPNALVHHSTTASNRQQTNTSPAKRNGATACHRPLTTASLKAV
ncbi:hypothetical protein D3C84_952140 [compost metagenome]